MLSMYRLLTFSKLTFSKNSFGNTISVKHFRPRSGPTFCRSWSGSKLFAKVISRRQKSQYKGKVKVTTIDGWKWLLSRILLTPEIVTDFSVSDVNILTLSQDLSISPSMKSLLSWLVVYEDRGAEQLSPTSARQIRWHRMFVLFPLLVYSQGVVQSAASVLEAGILTNCLIARTSTAKESSTLKNIIYHIQLFAC